eukprot:361845-Chlamydomonas_euryale.AAC.2
MHAPACVRPRAYTHTGAHAYTITGPACVRPRVYTHTGTHAYTITVQRNLCEVPLRMVCMGLETDGMCPPPWFAETPSSPLALMQLSCTHRQLTSGPSQF